MPELMYIEEDVYKRQWAVLMQGTSQNPSKMWKLDMLPKTVSCLIAGVIFLGYVCFICKKKTIKRIAEEYKGLIVTFGAGLHIVIPVSYTHLDFSYYIS